MKYELNVLKALIQLPQPSTAQIVAATGISERKVQSALNTLQTGLGVKLQKIKDGRTLHYSITGWGVFETGEQLRQLLASQPLTGIMDKAAFYDSVKMSNYRESARLEGIQVTPLTQYNKESIARARQALHEKYATYNNVTTSDAR